MEQETGMPAVEVCRRHVLSSAAFYKLTAKYGGMEVSEAASLRRSRMRMASSNAFWQTPCWTMSC